MKLCTYCNVFMTEDSFSKNKNAKDGKQSKCKNCYKEYYKNHRRCTPEFESGIRKMNPDYHTNYYKTHKNYIVKDKVSKIKDKKPRKIDKEKIKNYYLVNRERILEHCKLYYIENKDILKERIKQYHKNNPDKRRQIKHIRKSRKKLLPATLTLTEWEKIKHYFSNKCCYCGKVLPLVQEHFLPVSSMGEYGHNNIVPSCGSCNSSKTNNDFFTWYPKYKYYSKTRESKILEFLHYNKGTQQLSLMI